MGIDIYARWRGQSDDELAAQCTGFSIAHGHVGYLREAYHGEPYATHHLVPEAFDDEALPDGVPICARVMRARLPKVCELAQQREFTLYGHDLIDEDTRLVLQSFLDFVSLCEAKEAETGEPCRIIASY